MKEIKLTQDKIVLVDDDDFDYLKQFKWCVGSDGYIRRTSTQRKSILMHREICNFPDKLDIDHINHNKLDNQKSNLRICTRSQNMANSKDSGYKGVRWNKNAQKWIAVIGYNYKRFYLGLFDDKDRAKEAYNAKAKKLFGEFAKSE